MKFNDNISSAKSQVPLKRDSVQVLNADLPAVLAEIRKLRADLRATQRRLLPVEDAAAYLGISAKSIRNRIGPRAQKPFPVNPVRLAGRVLFRREDLDAYIDSLAGGAE
jgi:hypothetical protein